jgi:rubrerythrin
MLTLFWFTTTVSQEKNFIAQKDMMKSTQKMLHEHKSRLQQVSQERDDLRKKLESMSKSLSYQSEESARPDRQRATQTASQDAAAARAVAESKKHDAELAKERWEQEKKWKKTIEGLKQKLEDKVRLSCYMDNLVLPKRSQILTLILNAEQGNRRPLPTRVFP